MAARQRALMAGWTDYTGVGLSDILEHLRDWQGWTGKTIEALRTYRSEVEQRADLLEDAGEVKRYIDYFVDLFSRYLGDLDRLIKEIPEGVLPRHVGIVEQIDQSSRSEESYCVAFKRNYIAKTISHEEVRPLLDAIYADSRQELIDFRDFSNLAPRLKTFVADAPTEPVFELRPNLWGIGVNLRQLCTKLGRWFPRI